MKLDCCKKKKKKLGRLKRLYEKKVKKVTTKYEENIGEGKIEIGAKFVEEKQSI